MTTNHSPPEVLMHQTVPLKLSRYLWVILTLTNGQVLKHLPRSARRLMLLFRPALHVPLEPAGSPSFHEYNRVQSA